jgi:hypothetical protein
VVDPELQTYVPEALIVPRAVELGDPAPPSSGRGPLKVVHAPSRRAVKGTQAIKDAVDRLQRDGVQIELQLIEQMSHDEALEAYRAADVVVDQLRIGWYGVVAVEAMAMGKAVVSFIRDDLKHHLPWPWPLAIANPSNIDEILADLAADRTRVDDLGRRGRQYAEHIHDADHIAEVLTSLYADAGRPADARAAAAWFALQNRIAQEQTKKHGRGRSVGRLLGLGRHRSGSRVTRPQARKSLLHHIRALFRILRQDGAGTAARKASRFLLKRLS